MSKPLILSTRAHIKQDNIDWQIINTAYTKAVEDSGGTMILFTGSPTEADIIDVIKKANGILIPGGGDVDPKYYGQPSHEKTGEHDDDRDTMELFITKYAIDNNIPLLAICRGLQVVNVAMGGTLHQHVSEHLPNSIEHDGHNDSEGKHQPRNTLIHDITINENCKLHQLIGETTIKTNSLHHQGIDKLGTGLVATAHTKDGLVEAFELAKEHPFFLGVQFHPEELTSDHRWKNLFDKFIEACKI